MLRLVDYWIWWYLFSCIFCCPLSSAEAKLIMLWSSLSHFTSTRQPLNGIFLYILLSSLLIYLLLKIEDDKPFRLVCPVIVFYRLHCLHRPKTVVAFFGWHPLTSVHMVYHLTKICFLKDQQTEERPPYIHIEQNEFTYRKWDFFNF